MSSLLISYTNRDTAIHRLCGATKLIVFLMWSLTGMATFDTRVIAAMLLFSLAAFVSAKVRWGDIKVVALVILGVMLLNLITIFIFAPDYGQRIYGTRYVLLGGGRYALTAEQLFYEVTVFFKYMTVIPIALLFIMATDPSEFASSLNKIKVNYRIAYAVSLALRYIPDVQRDFFEISHAQQARGLSIGRDVPLHRRLINAVSIIFPLIMVSLSRIDTIAQAMELRGFGKSKKRTWYAERPYKRADAVALVVTALLCAAALAVTASNGGRFYNPFV